MEATRWSVTGDCLEPLAREVAKLANKVRQGSLGPGVSSLDLKTLYRERKIDAATERLKTLFSVDYGREFAERTNRVLEQFRTAEFWAFKALELHPFGREGAGNRQNELQETYRREVGMAFQEVGFEPEREELLDRPELLAMFDALERYGKLVSSLIALKDYLFVVAGLVRSKTQPAQLGEVNQAPGQQNALAKAPAWVPWTPPPKSNFEWPMSEPQIITLPDYSPFPDWEVVVSDYLGKRRFKLDGLKAAMEAEVRTQAAAEAYCEKLLDAEAQTGTRLREGECPFWFLKIRYDFDWGQARPLPLTFAEYCAKRHPGKVATGGELEREQPAKEAAPSTPDHLNLLGRTNRKRIQALLGCIHERHTFSELAKIGFIDRDKADYLAVKNAADSLKKELTKLELFGYEISVSKAEERLTFLRPDCGK